MSNTDINYNRPVPPEWGGLLAQLDGTERPFSSDEAGFAVLQVDRLRTESLETNLYYGLGLGMCDIAQVLHDPTSRAQTAVQLANGLTEQGVSLRRLLEQTHAEVAIGDLALPALVTLGSLAQQNYNNMPPAQHLLSDALTITTRMRRIGSPVVVNGFVRSDIPARVTSGDASVRLIASNSLAASANLHRRALLAKRGVGPETQIEDLDPLDLLKVGRQSAGIHSEEFNTPSFLDTLLIADDKGQLVFRRGVLPAFVSLPAPGEAKRTEIMHEQRLGCPAVQVGGLITGILRLIPEIVEAQG